MQKLFIILFLIFCLPIFSYASNFSFGIGIDNRHSSHHYSHHRHHYSSHPLFVYEYVNIRDSIPYGYKCGNRVQSPYSDFLVSISGKYSGQIIYDMNTGEPFRVP